MAQDIVIGGRLHSAATGNTVAGTNEILDDAKGKKQNVINQEVDNEIGSDSAAGTIKGRIKNLETAVGSGGSVDERIAETKAEIIGDATADYNTLGKVEDKIQAETSRAEGAEGALDAAKANKAITLEGYGITDAYTKSETYNKTEVNGLVDTPHQNYVTVLTYAALIAIDPGSTDTIYRVSNYDGSVPQVDVTKYSEYAWDGTQYVFLCVKSQIDEVFDISVYNNNATYADLAAALGTDGANVPQTLRRGGMSVKFVHSVDNKYVQYRYMEADATTTATFTNVANWQGVTNEVAIRSNNLVDSDGIGKSLTKLNLVGLIGQSLDGYINANGTISFLGANYKVLLCPVVESKSYRYYSGVSGASSGARYAFFDATLTPLDDAVGIDSVGWIDITIPTGAKYFGANIKVYGTWPQSKTDDCCFIELTKYFTQLETLGTVDNTFSNNANVIADTEEQKKRISRSLFESGFAFISKLGITDKYYLGYIATADGKYTYINNSAYKTVIAKVVPGRKYKLYISGNNSAASDCGNYSFYSSDSFVVGNVLSHATSVAKNTWIELTAPANAQYFAVCMVFNNTGDINDCCFIEESKYLAKIDTEISSLTNSVGQLSGDVSNVEDYQDSIKPAFGFVSENIYDGKYVQGWIDPRTGALNENTTGKYYATEYIQVKPNHYYSLTGRVLMGDMAAAGYSQDKTTPHVLLRKDGTLPNFQDAYIYYLWSSNGVIVPNGIFKTDSDTYWVRFTIRFNDVPAEDYTHIMLEDIGDYYDDQFTPSPYVPYNAKIVINPECLPDNAASILSGKKIAYNGDSFCESRLSGFANNGGAYPVLIAEATGCTFENRAISGGRLSSTGDGRKIVDDVVNMDSDADLICFEGGVNDWSSNVPLGTFSISDYTSEFDEETITGALESIFRQAINKWVGKPICFIICHKVNAANTSFAAGNFWAVHDRMVEVCNKWSIPYYDAFLHSGLNGMIESQNNAFLNGGSNAHPDGWHPDRGGYVKYYVPQLIKLFESILQVNKD